MAHSERGAALVRLRSGRCFHADPDQQPRTGRPRRHGPTPACDDPSTWWLQTADHREGHAQYGQVWVHARADAHAKAQCQGHPDRGSRSPGPNSPARWFWLRSRDCHARPASPGDFGGGGVARVPRIRRSPGGRTSTGSTRSTPTASASRRSTGPRRASGTLGKRIAGPGWCCWPAPNSASRAELTRPRKRFLDQVRGGRSDQRPARHDMPG
jgi:hypothetical protein